MEIAHRLDGETSEKGARERFDRIYRTLRTRICMLDHPPLERLREEDLAAEFNVSRTPIRRVLVKLEAEGLLRSVHGVGTIVTDIEIDSLEQVYQLRVELAELIGKLSPIMPGEARMADFRALLARCDDLVRQPDPREFARTNMDFFHLLNGLTANEPLREISQPHLAEDRVEVQPVHGNDRGRDPHFPARGRRYRRRDRDRGSGGGRPHPALSHRHEFRAPAQACERRCAG